MDFTTAVKTCLAKYIDFSGRARRSEFWYFELFNLIVEIAAGIIDAITTGGASTISPVTLVTNLALFLPALAVLIRRLHDTDRSGWWWLIVFVPIIGVIVLLVFMCQRGTEGTNRFGAEPA